MHDMYFLAWRQGLKTTYYLRSLAASQVEKSTVDTAQYGATHRRDPAPEAAPKAYAIDNPGCESCQ